MSSLAINDSGYSWEAEQAAQIYADIILVVREAQENIAGKVKDLPNGDEFGCAEYLQDMISDLHGFKSRWEEKAGAA